MARIRRATNARACAAAAAVGLALGSWSPAWAAGACSRARTTQEMNQCIARDLAVTDRMLNAAYLKLLQRLSDDPQTRAGLVEAQRGWIRFRDLDCKAKQGQFEGGSMGSVVHGDCLVDHTRERARQLSTWWFGE